MEKEDMRKNLRDISGILSYWLEEVWDRLESEEVREEMESDFDTCQEYIKEKLEYLK